MFSFSEINFTLRRIDPTPFLPLSCRFTFGNWPLSSSASSSDIKNNTPVSGSSLIPFSIPTNTFPFQSDEQGIIYENIKEEENFVIQIPLKKRRKPNYYFSFYLDLGVAEV